MQDAGMLHSMRVVEANVVLAKGELRTAWRVT
jgi:hypothetical protein